MANTDVIVIEQNTKEAIDIAKGNNFADLPLNKRAFALSYIMSYNHREAAKEAGFVPDRGISLLRDPMISAFIAHLQDEIHISNVVTADFVRHHMVSLIPKLSGEEEVPMVLPNGEEIIAKKFHSGELINLLKELAKSTKFYEDGSGQGNGGVTVNINVAALLGGGHNEGLIIEQEGKKVDRCLKLYSLINGQHALTNLHSCRTCLMAVNVLSVFGIVERVKIQGHLISQQ